MSNLDEIKARYEAVKDSTWELTLREDQGWCGAAPRDKWHLKSSGDLTDIDGLEDYERTFIEYAPQDIGVLLAIIDNKGIVDG